jgi:alpha-beta hydrolase superfamily lysophospholipase
MQFFSGFSLKNDEHFFTQFIEENPFYVYGFSYGAIKAFKEVQKRVQNSKRVDKLVMFSPAFFQTKSQKFIRLQLLGFQKDSKKYVENFLTTCFAPLEKQEVTQDTATKEALEELLTYQWELEALQALKDAGVALEVYLGGNDGVIDHKGAFDFFTKVCDVTYIKNANHFLQVK